MALQLVSQESHTGCFIACVAMLLGKTYKETFSLFYPGKNADVMYSHGFREMSMEGAAHRLLGGLGFKSRTSKYKKFRTYQNRITKHTIMIIRWKFDPTMCHCVLFDADTKSFIEPDGGYIITDRWTLKHLERQLECGIVIEETPVLNSGTPSDIYRSPDPFGLAW